jgi:hypothetical protein
MKDDPVNLDGRRSAAGEVASRTHDEAGDGTTTATVLAHPMRVIYAPQREPSRKGGDLPGPASQGRART